MLRLHLDSESELASRPAEAIDRVVDWLDRSFGLEGASVCDLGCGPGLYARRYAEHGATVHGLDFSRNSIDFARSHATLSPGSPMYQVADYLKASLPAKQDLITLIYCDLCPLSPDQRRSLLSKVRRSLAPGGVFVFDVFSMSAFEGVTESVSFGRHFMDGFWSAHDYFAFKHTHRYDAEAVSLDRYTIIEEDNTWEVFNWLQFYSRDTIAAELKQAGFVKLEFTDGFGRDPSDTDVFGVIATA
ncbi:MAG: class I SAM-dependent methyltransferase [Candidatus Phaeomarinobacter sp.]